MPPRGDHSSTIVIGKQRKTHAYTLTRVRNNQRRHRERRRDYVVSLEQKLAETECLLGQAHTEIANLKAELEKRNLTDNVTESHPNIWDATTLALDSESRFSSSQLLVGEQMIPAEEQPSSKRDDMTAPLAPPSATATENHLVITTTVAADSVTSTPASNWPSLMDFSALTLSPSSTSTLSPVLIDPEPALEQSPRTYPPPCCLPMDEQAADVLATATSPYCADLAFLDRVLLADPCDSYPAPDDKESTTLCSQACVLITAELSRTERDHNLELAQSRFSPRTKQRRGMPCGKRAVVRLAGLCQRSLTLDTNISKGFGAAFLEFVAASIAG